MTVGYLLLSSMGVRNEKDDRCNDVFAGRRTVYANWQREEKYIRDEQNIHTLCSKIDRSDSGNQLSEIQRGGFCFNLQENVVVWAAETRRIEQDNLLLGIGNRKWWWWWMLCINHDVTVRSCVQSFMKPVCFTLILCLRALQCAINYK